MKKNKRFIIIFLMCCYLSCFGLGNAETTEDEFIVWMNTVLEKNPDYKQLNLAYNLEKRNLFYETAKWLPAPYINLNSGNAGIETDKKYYSFQTSTVAGISQNIPMGITADVYGEQTLSIFFNTPKEFSYNFSSGANVSIPLWIIAPSMVGDFVRQEITTGKKKKELLELEVKTNKKKLMVKTVSVLTSEKFIKKRMELLQNLKTLLDQESEKNEILFMQGKLSALEISEFEKKRNQTEINFLSLKNEYEKITAEIFNLGLTITDINSSLHEWLICLEEFTERLKKKNALKDETTRLKNEIAWMEQVKKMKEGIPKILLSCGFDVIPKEDVHKTFVSSIKNYWKNSPKLKWNVTASIKINLAPWYEGYRINKNFKLAKLINKIQTNKIERQTIEAEKQRKLNLEAAEKILQTAKELFNLQKKYLDMSTHFYELGKISTYEFEVQKNVYAEAELNYFSERFKMVLLIFENYLL